MNAESNYEEIKKQAQSHKGLTFTVKGFRYAFNCTMTGSIELLNRLERDGIVEKIESCKYRVV